MYSLDCDNGASRSTHSVYVFMGYLLYAKVGERERLETCLQHSKVDGVALSLISYKASGVVDSGTALESCDTKRSGRCIRLRQTLPPREKNSHALFLPPSQTEIKHPPPTHLTSPHLTSLLLTSDHLYKRLQQQLLKLKKLICHFHNVKLSARETRQTLIMAAPSADISSLLAALGIALDRAS